MITYHLEPDLRAEEFVDLLLRSTLAERRPISEKDTMERMLRQASVIVTARLEGGSSASRGRFRISLTAPTFRTWL